MFSAERIKKLRLKMMMSQTEFAKELGVTFESVNRYENNKSKPTFKVQKRLSELMEKYNIEE